MELNSVILTTAGSAVFFRLVNNAFGQLPMPESACKNAWRWRNICTSFVHSIITGIWAVLCFFLHPQMAEDLIETHSVFSHALVSVSIGYFIYDFFDMVVHQKLSQSWELLFHHVVVKENRSSCLVSVFVNRDGNRRCGLAVLYSSYVTFQCFIECA
ncbi:unnamed protein product [Boreogadus saida]